MSCNIKTALILARWSQTERCEKSRRWNENCWRDLCEYLRGHTWKIISNLDGIYKAEKMRILLKKISKNGVVHNDSNKGQSLFRSKTKAYEVFLQRRYQSILWCLFQEKIKDISFFWKYRRAGCTVKSFNRQIKLLSRQGAAELHSTENFKTKHLLGKNRETSLSLTASRLNGLLRSCAGLHFGELEITSTITLGCLVLRTQLHFNPGNSFFKKHKQCMFVFLIYKLPPQHHSRPLLSTCNGVMSCSFISRFWFCFEVSVL